ncbi:MAG: ribonuclease R [Gammaproteobacteria bacterium]|nr:ribonuclease R [Gammaproteobacteria bacterium]
MRRRRGEAGRSGKRGAAAGLRQRGGRHGASGGHPQSARPGATRARQGAIHEARVSAHRSGFGFARVEGLEESVFLSPSQMSGLVHGDRVRVALTQDRAGRWSGRVTDVLERGVSAFLGTIAVQGRTAFVHSADRRLGLRCLVPPAALHGARGGDWVIARITRYPRGEGGAQAEVLRRLDPDRPVELATEAAIARFNLPQEFSAEALRDARAFGTEVDPAEAARRRDLRALPLVTIDGEDAKDFDDAVYAEPHPQGFRLIVAIADVSHYVRPGTALDQAALERGTSVYFPSRVIPMLPTALSNHLCSLEPAVDRLCFVADMVLSHQGALRAAGFYPAVMRSAKRLTYTLAQAALFEGRPAARGELDALAEPLRALVEVYRALQKARRRRGALDFDAAEAEFDLDDSGRVRAIDLRARNDAHRLIEECMIMANVAVAQELGSQHVGTLYRVHGQPEERKLDQLASTLGALGIAAEIPETITPRDLQRVTQRLGESAERPFVESLIVRAMPQALYQPANIGHFGLALKAYAHFTSPIRRYPDLVVHRTLRARLEARGAAARRYEGGELAALGESLSKLEKRADEADRSVSVFLKCVYLRERIGQSFRGLITSVVEFGCFVQLLEVAADGLLHTDALRDDEYVLEEGGHAWAGLRTGRRLRLGTHVDVIVTGANPIEGLIDLELAGIGE